MRSYRLLATIDFHTAGIGMRLLTSGLGAYPEARSRRSAGGFRSTDICGPPFARAGGHRGLLIAVMTEPVTPAAHFGLFFMYPGGYYVSCGEGTIGAATVAVETGLVERTGAETNVLIDTEAGPVETIVRSAGDRVREVTLRWAPSFVALPEQVVEVDGVGEVPVDVAIGVGNVFVIVEAKHLGVSVRRELAKRIAQRGMAVRHAVNAQLRVEVPGLGKTSVDNVLVHELPDADGVSPNALVWVGPGRRGAVRSERAPAWRSSTSRPHGGGSTFVSQGLLGLSFTARIGGLTRVEGRAAILPEITGTAYLTGFSQHLFDPDDPMKAGYLLDV